MEMLIDTGVWDHTARDGHVYLLEKNIDLAIAHVRKYGGVEQLYLHAHGRYSRSSNREILLYLHEEHKDTVLDSTRIQRVLIFDTPYRSSKFPPEALRDSFLIRDTRVMEGLRDIFLIKDTCALAGLIGPMRVDYMRFWTNGRGETLASTCDRLFVIMLWGHFDISGWKKEDVGLLTTTEVSRLFAISNMDAGRLSIFAEVLNRRLSAHTQRIVHAVPQSPLSLRQYTRETIRSSLSCVGVQKIPLPSLLREYLIYDKY